MKKKSLALLFLPIFTLASCVTTTSVVLSRNNNTLSLYTIPPYTPPTPPEQPKNVLSIDILGIPEDYKIGMGLFDEANIRCQITYTDNSTSSFQLLEENLPYEVREMLGQEGEHNVTIQIRNQKVTFKIIMVDEGIRYVVRFLNYNDDVLYMTKVMPDNKVTYLGDEPKRMSDVVYKYQYRGWDHDIDTYLVTESTDIYAQYDPIMKNNDYIPNDLSSQYISSYKGLVPDASWEGSYVCHYVGRMTNFQIARYIGGYTHHTKGHKELISYDFGEGDTPIDPDYGSPVYDCHPNIQNTLSGAITKSYKYVDPAGAIDPKYIPAAPYLINQAYIDDIPFELHSIRTRNKEGKTFVTAVNDFKEVITDYLSTPRVGDLLIPEDFEDGDYTATLFADFDIYAYVYAEKKVGIVNNNAIFAVACISDMYIGLNSYENRLIPFNYTTTTYDEDMMTIELFAPMMEKARKGFEE